MNGLLFPILLQKNREISQGWSGGWGIFKPMLYFKNNPSILDSSTASRSLSFLICSVSFLICSFSLLSSAIRISVSSVPLKAEINQKSRRRQTEHQETVVNDGEGESGEGDGVGVAIKPQ